MRVERGTSTLGSARHAGIPARYVALLSAVLAARGVARQDWLRAAGADVALLDDPSAQILPDELERLLIAAERLGAGTDLGFELGLRVKLTSHDQLSLGLLGSPDFDAAFRLAARHFHLMVRTFTLRYRRLPGRGEVAYAPTVPMPTRTLHFLYEAIAVSVQQAVFSLLGPVAFDIEVAMAQPPHAWRYDALLPARFRFEPAALPGLRAWFDAELLDRPLPLADEQMVQRVDERCAALAPRPGPEQTDWVEVVRLALRGSPGEQVTLQALAERHRARTIDRQLKKRQLRFRDLAQQVRLERACELLCEPGATVAQVALNLGFSDAANFSRAFRRQVGIAPGEYRARAQAGPRG